MKAIALANATVIDGTGAQPRADWALLLEGERLTYVGPMDGFEPPAGASVLDCGGKTVMPGIIEAHAHVGGDFKAVRTLRLSLQRGITTICDVNANLDGIRLRNAISGGMVRGCSRTIAGCMVTPTHGHVKFRTADGPWEVRKAVREMVDAGADFIKTAASGGFWAQNEKCSSPNYTLEELHALTEEAHAWEVPVAVHVHTQPGLANCIECGTDMIHHGAFIDPPAVLGIKDKGLYYIPTLTVTCQRNIASFPDQPWQTEEMALAQPIHREGVRLAHQVGVTLGVGTDYPGNPRGWRIGDRTMVELQELQQCGLSALEAITAATRNNAAAYGKLDDLGTLEVGKRADLLLVASNPLADLGVLYDQQNLCAVIKDGRVEYADEAHRDYYQLADE
ncbi:MAG: amidohydrolase family protein [Armatimonadia bacterium]